MMQLIHVNIDSYDRAVNIDNDFDIGTHRHTYALMILKIFDCEKSNTKQSEFVRVSG